MSTHKLVNGTLTHDTGGGIVARCTCGWSSEHFSSMAASAAFMDHQERNEPTPEDRKGVRHGGRGENKPMTNPVSGAVEAMCEASWERLRGPGSWEAASESDRRSYREDIRLGLRALAQPGAISDAACRAVQDVWKWRLATNKPVTLDAWREAISAALTQMESE